MTADYQAIARDHTLRYGTDVDRYGPDLLANRYSAQEHFVFELLQNAEDALARLASPTTAKLTLSLDDRSLEVTHYGAPFTEEDVRSICHIGLSTKSTGSIGRFGIGFKAVYALTDRPEIRSGGEQFAIESFVRPVALPAKSIDHAATSIRLPFANDKTSLAKRLSAFLKAIDPNTLLFLKEISEVDILVGKEKRVLLRRSAEIDPQVRRVSVSCREAAGPAAEQDWLVFDAISPTSRAPRVSIAFRCDFENERPRRVKRLDRSPIFCYFPTAIESNLGFLLQGTFRTTPSRDNIAEDDETNRQLVGLATELLLLGVRWMRGEGILDINVLTCLPFPSTKFPDGFILAPMQRSVAQALRTEPLLPTAGDSFVSATNAKASRSAPLRALFGSNQLSALFNESGLEWVSPTLLGERSRGFHEFLRLELGVQDVGGEIITRLNTSFLSRQDASWFRQLYETLFEMPALAQQMSEKPIVRLTDRSLVAARRLGHSQAFLPTNVQTDFPTVDSVACGSEKAISFLRSLGIGFPDLVDDVIRHVLPKFSSAQQLSKLDYSGLLDRIGAAARSDSILKREALRRALGQTAFVRARGSGSRAVSYVRPSEAYLATERLRALFSGIPEVLLTDRVIRGEALRELVQFAGTPRTLTPETVDERLDWADARELRKVSGCEQSSGLEWFNDHTLRGLERVLRQVRKLHGKQRRHRCEQLWDALRDAVERSPGILQAEHRWTYMTQRSAYYSASFVRLLRTAQWIPTRRGGLQAPHSVEFAATGWKPNDLLVESLHFKPPLVDQLAIAVGVDADAIEFLKEHRLSRADLERLMGQLKKVTSAVRPQSPKSSPTEAVDASAFPAASATQPDATPLSEPVPSRVTASSATLERAQASTTPANVAVEFVDRDSTGRSFVTSIAGPASPSPAGARDSENLAVEAAAIRFILESEPRLRRTREGNRGFDLYEPDAEGSPIRWIEVKAISSSWAAQAVTLSPSQYLTAAQQEDAYWLYVVEFATDNERRKLYRIRNPARSSYHVFDAGWASLHVPLTDRT